MFICSPLRKAKTEGKSEFPSASLQPESGGRFLSARAATSIGS